jgi:iron complex transport system substrate-binding protein
VRVARRGGGRSVTLLVVALAALAAGCADSEPEAGSPAESTAPVIAATPASGNTSPGTPEGSASAADPALPVTLTDATGAEVTVSSVERIVPVDGDLAEIVFALGLGDRVVATDISATYPPEVDEVPDIGYQRALSAEPIAAVEPTVVLATDLARPEETLSQLRDLHIPVVVIDRAPTLEGPADKIQAVADALGVPDRGAALAEQVQADIDAAVQEGSAATSTPRVLPLYLRGDNVQLILGTGYGLETILPAVGASDVAAELGIVDTRPITAEAVVAAAPDVLLVTTTGLESVGGIDGLLAISGLAETPAGRSRRILAYEDQYLLGGGPRTGQMMRELVDDLHSGSTTTT